MNPLVETFRDICVAGYEKRNVLNSRVVSPKIKQLANFLLNRSTDATTFRIRQEPWVDNSEVAIGFGGGIDSYCALHYALGNGMRVHLVHVDYGQPYFRQERSVFNRISLAWSTLGTDCRKDHIENVFFKDLKTLEESMEVKFPRDQLQFHTDSKVVVPENQDGMDWENYIVPARNLLLAGVCAEYARQIWIVATKRSDETVGTPDKTTRFYKQTSEILSQHYGMPFSVLSPFIGVSKFETVKNYLLHHGSLETLKQTWSCYSPTFGASDEWKKQCGTCYACFKRYQLFQKLDEQIDFVTHPRNGKNWDKFVEQELKKRG